MKHVYTDLQLYCKSNPSPALHHGSALCAAIGKPERATLPWDEPQLRVLMSLSPLCPPRGFRERFDKRELPLWLLCVAAFVHPEFCGQHARVCNKKNPLPTSSLCAVSWRSPTMNGQQAPGGSVGQTALSGDAPTDKFICEALCLGTSHKDSRSTPLSFAALSLWTSYWIYQKIAAIWTVAVRVIEGLAKWNRSLWNHF